MQEKRSRKKSTPAAIPTKLELIQVLPQTENQEKVFEAWSGGQHLMLSGMAGTGKTFVSLYLALKEVARRSYDRVVVVRSIVPTRDPGFLPGKLWEKVNVYETPYESICTELYEDASAYDTLKKRGTIEFLTTSFIRGTTLTDCVVVVDEIQNMRWGEIASVVTRVGKNSRLVCIGDYRQTDLTRVDERRGIADFTRVAKRMQSFSHFEFGYDDILRSDLVKEFLIAKDQLGIVD